LIGRCHHPDLSAAAQDNTTYKVFPSDGRLPEPIDTRPAPGSTLT
jgi:hypothetical protein